MTEEDDRISKGINEIEGRIINWFDQNIPASGRVFFNNPMAKNRCCPTPEMLHRFVLGAMGDTENDSICRHIEICRQCATEALKLSITEEELDSEIIEIQPKLNVEDCLSEQSDIVQAHERVSSNLIQKLKGTYFRYRMYFSAIPAVAAACLLLYIVWPVSYESKIDDLYSEFSSREWKIETDVYGDPFRLPWEKPNQKYAFSPASKKHSPANFAFGAGLWEGRREINILQSSESTPDYLLPPDDVDGWDESRYAFFFHLGRWAFLFRTACISNNTLTDDFWADQALALERLDHELDRVKVDKEKYVAYVREKFGRIERQMKTESNLLRRRRLVGGELYGLMNHLSPRI